MFCFLKKPTTPRKAHVGLFLEAQIPSQVEMMTDWNWTDYLCHLDPLHSVWTLIKISFSYLGSKWLVMR